ncbi:hypothetical protein GCM10023079_21830 [Streptomyces chitinivorans]
MCVAILPHRYITHLVAAAERRTAGESWRGGRSGRVRQGKIVVPRTQLSNGNNRSGMHWGPVSGKVPSEAGGFHRALTSRRLGPTGSAAAANICRTATKGVNGAVPPPRTSSRMPTSRAWAGDERL